MNRALFLDRDGVINHDAGYTSCSDHFKFVDGIFDLCRLAKEFGYLLIVVTNQAGIGRGYYSEQDFFKLTAWMCEQFEAKDVPITDVFFCPDHPQHGLGHYKKDSFDRKPNPGMLLRAAEKYQVSLKDSIMVGDKDSDMVAAKRAGVGVRWLYEHDGKVLDQALGAATYKICSLQEATVLLCDVVTKQASLLMSNSRE